MMAFSILQKEVGIKIYRNRFAWGKYHVPLNIFIFERKGELGFCEPSQYYIGLHRRLMYESKTEVLENIIRHELAHLICYLEFGSQIRSHGIEFRQICQRYHWGEEVYKAAASLEIENQKVSNSLDEEKVMDKIKKLLSLAQSQNPHEKEMATLRANDLITKYNLEHTRKFSFSNSNEVEEEVCTECVLFFSRISQKYLTISSILRHFFVYPVFSKNDRGGYLEVCGDKTNVEIASYVASFLDNSLEDLWQKTKREKNLSGIPMKNSFFRGLAQGYDEKILKQQEMFKTYNSNLGKDLIILEKKLKQKVNIAYSHLGSVQSRGQHSVSAHEIGKQKGKNLQIHAGLKNGVMTPLLN